MELVLEFIRRSFQFATSRADCITPAANSTNLPKGAFCCFVRCMYIHCHSRYSLSKLRGVGGNKGHFSAREFRSPSLEIKKFGRIPILYCPFFLCLFVTETQAQQVTLSGYVEDAKSGERLVGATLYAANRGVGTVTNT